MALPGRRQVPRCSSFPNQRFLLSRGIRMPRLGSRDFLPERLRSPLPAVDTRALSRYFPRAAEAIRMRTFRPFPRPPRIAFQETSIDHPGFRRNPCRHRGPVRRFRFDENPTQTWVFRSATASAAESAPERPGGREEKKGRKDLTSKAFRDDNIFHLHGLPRNKPRVRHQ